MIEYELGATLLSQYSIELTLHKGISADNPIYLETEKRNYRIDQPKLDMKYADLYRKKFIGVLSESYPEESKEFFAQVKTI